ncbi:MAG: hypothetical protein ACOC1U_09045, partial [Spirochaetota bacterium]
LSEALERLDPLDPRRDPFVESLSDYFRSDGRNALYARFDGGPGAASRAVRRALGAGSEVAEWSPSRSLASIGLVIATGIVVVLLSRPRRAALLVVLLPWVPAVVAFGLSAAVVASVLVLATAWLTEEVAGGLPSRATVMSLRPGSFGYRTAGLVVLLALSAVYVVRLAGALAAVSVIVAAVGSVAGVFVALCLRSGRRDPEHVPFEPVSILSRRGVAGRLPDSGARWARVALVIVPILLLLPPVADRLLPGGAARPVTREHGGVRLDHESIVELARMDELVAAGTDGSRRLPDIADFLAHRAYQESLAYGGTYAFPEPGERVEILRFREQADGSYASFSEPVIIFDESWVETALAEAPRGIVELLVGIGRPVGVVSSPSDTLYSGYSQLVHHVAFVLLAMAPMLLRFLRWPRQSGARESILELGRRRKQVA